MQLAARLRVAAVHAGPLSEVGELRDPTEDTHSIYGDSDLMSSDGRDQVQRQSSPSAPSAHVKTDPVLRAIPFTWRWTRSWCSANTPWPFAQDGQWREGRGRSAVLR